MTNEIFIVAYAIQAAIRLGRKVRTVFEEETRDRDLVLPPIETPDLPPWGVVKSFFESEGQAFVADSASIPGRDATPHGLYCEWWRRQNDDRACRDNLRRAYLAIQQGLDPLRSADDVNRGHRIPGSFYTGANALFLVKQWRDGADPKRSPVQRIAGTVIDIALDYVKVDPTLFSGNGTGDRITRAFLLSLSDVDFAESDYDDLLLDVMRASLDTFRAHADIVISEEHLAVLLRQISRTLAGSIDAAERSGDDDKLRALYRLRRDVLQDVIRVSAQTVSENMTAFVGVADNRKEQLLETVFSAVVDTIATESDLINRKTLTDIYAASLRAVAQNPALLLPEKEGRPSQALLRNLIAGIGAELARSSSTVPPGIFTPEIGKDIIGVALQVLADHLPTLADPGDPEKQLLVDALHRLALSISDDFHADKKLSALLDGLFSRHQLVNLARVVFTAVSRNPEGLLQGVDDDSRRSALAQIVGSVAASISTDAKRFLSGDNYLDLLAVALEAFMVNPDRLLSMDTADPADNVMARVIAAVVDSVIKNARSEGRNLLNGDLLVAAVETALAVVSKNVDGFAREPEIMSMVMDRLLNAATHVLANELDAENLIVALEAILPAALRGREVLDQSDADLILPHIAHEPRYRAH